MQKWIIFILAGVLCLSCTESTNNPENTVDNEESLPTSLFTKEKPQDAISITQARSLQSGSTVKVHGQIMGNKKPFVEGRASFIIGDPAKISACEDECDAPWDCCCDDKKTIAAAILSIQVLNQDGKVVKATIKGREGLKELSKVVVTGKVAPGSNDQFMVINAQEIYVE